MVVLTTSSLGLFYIFSFLSTGEGVNGSVGLEGEGVGHQKPL